MITLKWIDVLLVIFNKDAKLDDTKVFYKS